MKGLKVRCLLLSSGCGDSGSGGEAGIPPIRPIRVLFIEIPHHAGVLFSKTLHPLAQMNVTESWLVVGRAVWLIGCYAFISLTHPRQQWHMADHYYVNK